jgi:tRNA-dihydrouridine synthase B
MKLKIKEQNKQSMKNNFWQNIKKPILVLAPMAGFTNLVFRRICLDYQADVVYSEMASASALFYQKNIEKTLKILKTNKQEKNYVVQLFGSEPEHFALATKIVSKEIKPSGIDINFGCPVPKVLKQKAGVYLMQDKKRARDIILAVLNNTNLPVSIKVRKEAFEVSVLNFLEEIIKLPISAIMVHARSLKQGFSGEIDYNIIKEIKKKYKGIVIANGGINNLEQAQKTLKVTKADGLGLARGILGRPWLFQEIKEGREIKMPLNKILEIMRKQANLVERELGKEAIVDLRKHLCWYVKDMPQASAYRQQLVAVSKASDLKKII